MPVSQRLCWIEEQIIAGRSFHLSFGGAQKNDTVKYKIQLGAFIEISQYHVQAALDCVTSMRRVFAQSLVVDRGHQYSNGRSEISFYVQARPRIRTLESVATEGNSITDALPPPVPPPISQLVDLTSDEYLIQHIDRKVSNLEEALQSQVAMLDTTLKVVADNIDHRIVFLHETVASCNHGIYSMLEQYNQTTLGSSQQLIDAQNLVIAGLRARSTLETNINERLNDLAAHNVAPSGHILPIASQSLDDKLIQPLKEMENNIMAAVNLYAETACAIQADHDNQQEDNATTLQCINSHLEELRFALHRYNELTLVQKDSVAVQAAPTCKTKRAQFPPNFEPVPEPVPICNNGRAGYVVGTSGNSEFQVQYTDGGTDIFDEEMVRLHLDRTCV